MAGLRIPSTDSSIKGEGKHCEDTELGNRSTAVRGGVFLGQRLRVCTAVSGTGVAEFVLWRTAVQHEGHRLVCAMPLAPSVMHPRAPVTSGLHSDAAPVPRRPAASHIRLLIDAFLRFICLLRTSLSSCRRVCGSALTRALWAPCSPCKGAHRARASGLTQCFEALVPIMPCSGNILQELFLHFLEPWDTVCATTLGPAMRCLSSPPSDHYL